MEKEHGTTIPRIYEITIKGRLDERWSDWFEGLKFNYHSDGTTTLHGPIADQAALHGVLNGIRDLGLELVSVSRLGPGQVDEKPSPVWN